MNFIDLRSDTVTWPTDQMREAMKNAAVGDDGYGDDPTTIELESYAASLTGKEAAIFVPSGTFGNQLALFTHCRRGQEVVLDDSSQIVQHEAGASSIIAGVQLRTVSAQGPVLDHEEYA
ncbi:MAG: threonine aldolase, partial [Spirochaetaceae bacterium]|nr:threonine aldolase [Spirochaetaceae bacterium]